MSFPIYLNNIQKFQHNLEWNKQAPDTQVQGMEVFFDLRTNQASDIDKLRQLLGHKCCVFKRQGSSDVRYVLAYFRLLHIDHEPSTIIDDGKTFTAVALRGTRSEIEKTQPNEHKRELLKSTLLDEAPFLFNKLKHLKQRSVFYA